jgi:hypothetical protein
MKPMSPEEKELEALQSEAARRYRALPGEDPPARLDEEVIAAARRELEPPRTRRSWQVPASVAAVLVVGTTLALLVRDVEEPLAPAQAPSASKADLAKAAPDAIALKTVPESSPTRSLAREQAGRPSRERTARPGTDLETDEAANASLTFRQSAPASAPAATAAVEAEPAGRESELGDRAAPAQEAESRSGSPAPTGATSAAVEAKKTEEPLRRREATLQALSPEQVRDRALERIRHC